jgi:cytochrome c-type biogenesis protein CcmH/NrfG
MGGRRVGLAVVVMVATVVGTASGQPAPSAQGKIVALNGRVEHTAAPQEQWNAARMFQPLLVSERVRTLEASRAAILFIDETQVKLNAGAILTIREVRRSGGGATALELTRGEGWFRTKNPRSGLTIQTPAAAAAVRGTEINLRVGPADETVLTVVEGSAEFSNTQGSILVNAGEEGTARPGQAPTKRVILNPDDAVQWALYYPAQIAWRDLPAAARSGSAAAGFERLRAGDAAGALQVFQTGAAGDIWSRIGASMAYLDAGDTERARQVLADESGVVGEAAAERRAQLAAAALATGDIAGARREIDAALAQNPTAVRPLVLLSSIELRQNRPDAARAAAERALAAHPDSVGALVAASEAAQSRFDLGAARAYLDRAIALDDHDVHALVNRARIRFGIDDTPGAREDADRAAGVSANDPQVRSLRGFIHLAEGRVAAARSDFEAAAQADVEFGEPHLGLGLTHFRGGRVEDGLLEMLTATLLEPQVALYQSYLGKAYYQARRVPEGLSALASAKRLDPRDPTPWLYASFYLRDQNQQVNALNELRHAISLNDHRAVYRSRLLLDRDLATKNVSLAEIYRQLGFEAWGAYEALNSLEVDVTNASAHLFLAETYLRLPDRNEGASSELLQYFLYAPVNRNSFNSFAEYTALLEQPRRQLTLTSETGSRERAFGNINHRFGNERYAHVAFFQAARQEGSRTGREDDRVQGFYQGKLSLGRRSDLFLSVSIVRDNAGAPENATRLFGLESATPVILRQFTLPNPTQTNRFNDTETGVGLKHQWRPGSALTASVRYDELEQSDERPGSTTSRCRGFDLTPFGAHSTGKTTNPFQTLDAQVQQATRIGRHQVIVGQQILRVDKKDQCSEVLTIDASGESLNFAFDTSGEDSAEVTYVRDEFQVTRWLHASVGVAYQQMKYRDISAAQTFDIDKWNPRVGMSARLSPTTVVRVAAFRELNTNILGANISPPTVSGFVIARNEFPTATRKEYNASVEHSGGRAFVAIQGFYRDTTVPFLLVGGTSFIPEADASGTGASAYVNWIASRRLTLFADNQLIRLEAKAFDRIDNLARIGLNVIHPRGVFVRLTGSHVTQRFGGTTIAGLPRSNFVLADVDVSYEFAGKRGLASLAVTNAFDRHFGAVIEGVSVDTFLPDRRALLSLRWRLF